MIQIKNVTPSLFLKDNIAVIGSSSSLLGNNLGKIIDSFDEVVRFNRAPTGGWEKHVGSKTTLRVSNNHVFSNVKHNVSGDENCDDWKPQGQPQNFIKDLINQKILLLNRDYSAWKEKVGELLKMKSPDGKRGSNSIFNVLHISSHSFSFSSTSVTS